MKKFGIWLGILQLGILSELLHAATVVEYQCKNEDIQWAGMSCFADDPCPIYLELSSVEAVGDRIFLVGNIHSSSTTLYSILLASDDAGQTWKEPHERIRGAGLDRIQFVDFEHGWISGETQHPLPRDPFFLITADGGQTWTEHSLFADSTAASVTQFWFTSRTNGSMLVDQPQPGEVGRYQLYETVNGGETWSLKESSARPLKLRHEGTPNADWSIRADAATKSYQIEHHASDRWHAVASFPVTIGSCKPSEPPPSNEAPVALPPGADPQTSKPPGE